MAERMTTKSKAVTAKATTGKSGVTRATAPTKSKSNQPNSGKSTAETISKTPDKAPKVAGKKSVTAQAAGSLQIAVERLESRMAELKRERDALAQELVAARQEIAALETARTQAINRIDWVLDSLQSLTEDKS
jgi:chromosome segregation ATPase